MSSTPLSTRTTTLHQGMQQRVSTRLVHSGHQLAPTRTPRNVACRFKENHTALQLLENSRAANMTIRKQTQPEHATGTLVFLGTYNNYSVLPHWPRGEESNDGLVVGRWKDGKLSVLHKENVLNPAFMKMHPNPALSVLYVLTECIHTEGYLTAYKVDPETGSLRELGRVTLTGRSSCYISFDKFAHHAIITNYWDGLINVVELSPAGVPVRVVQEHQQTRRPSWRQVENREDHMANRQDGPHAHCNVFHPSYNWVFVPDLGDNAIHQYGYKDGRLTHQCHVALPPGEGPRHFVFHPTLPVAYSGCELLSRVQVFAVDNTEPEAVRPRIQALQSHSTLPEDFTTTNYVGEIKVDAAGRFVYVSNRGHNSIAVYAIDQTTGHLSPVAIQKTGGKCPRHFGLSPCGRFAVVGDQDSNVVRVFKICPNNGTLDLVQGGEYPFGSPCFVMFHKPVLPVESHHAMHPVVRVASSAAAEALASLGPDSPPDSTPNNTHNEEMAPTTMVACS